jgi:hypothetical protein
MKVHEKSALADESAARNVRIAENHAPSAVFGRVKPYPVEYL